MTDALELKGDGERITDLQIRRYRPGDKDEVWELSCKALDPYFPNPDRRKNPRQADFDDIEGVYSPGKKADFLIGTVGGKIVAIAGLQKKPEEENVAYLRRWRVDPDYQRRGYGAQMLKAVEDRAREFDYTKIEAITCSLLTDAVEQYPKNGYQETKREPLPVEWNLDAEWVYFEKDL